MYVAHTRSASSEASSASCRLIPPRAARTHHADCTCLCVATYRSSTRKPWTLRRAEAAAREPRLRRDGSACKTTVRPPNILCPRLRRFAPQHLTSGSLPAIRQLIGLPNTTEMPLFASTSVAQSSVRLSGSDGVDLKTSWRPQQFDMNGPEKPARRALHARGPLDQAHCLQLPAAIHMVDQVRHTAHGKTRPPLSARGM